MSLLLVTPVYASSVEYVEAPEEVKEIVEPTWQEEFYSLPISMQNVAHCESGLNTNAKNPYSSASGLFQFIDGTFAWVWKEVYQTPVDWTMKNNPKVQIKLATWLYENYGLSHWECYTLGLI